jgi:hypothetical protein
MTEGPPEALTAKGMTTDIAATVVFLLGTALIYYIKQHFQAESGVTGTFLLLSELTLMCFAAGNLLRGANYLWGQFSCLLELIAKDPNLPRLKAAATWALGGALRALRAILTFAVGALAGIIVVLIIWAALLATLHHFGIEMSPLLEKLDEFFGIRGFAAPSEPELPTPLDGQIVFATVLGLLISGWLVRGVSYVVQRRWLPVLPE